MVLRRLCGILHPVLRPLNLAYWRADGLSPEDPATAPAHSLSTSASSRLRPSRRVGASSSLQPPRLRLESPEGAGGRWPTERQPQSSVSERARRLNQERGQFMPSLIRLYRMPPLDQLGVGNWGTSGVGGLCDGPGGSDARLAVHAGPGPGESQSLMTRGQAIGWRRARGCRVGQVIPVCLCIGVPAVAAAICPRPQPTPEATARTTPADNAYCARW